jgi:thioesterase domain-containing protein
LSDTTDPAGLGAELERIWHETIPISAQMGIEVLGWEDGELTIRGALAPNVNIHGTAFAGSLFAVAALGGWGALWLALRMRGIDAKIVLTDGHIEYKRPVTEAIVCRCHFDTTVQTPNIEQLERTDSSVFPLTCTIAATGRRAVQFEGEYAVRL